MFKGNLTSKLYEACLNTGFCEDHKKELEITDIESYEVQRKAFLYLRLQIFSPLLFQKPFIFDKMKILFTGNCFGSRNDADFHEKILYLDSIIVFSLCHFAKEICCMGSLFKSNQEADADVEFEEGTLIEILKKKILSESDIGYLVPLLKENFNGDKESVYKLGYVATLLIVRNVGFSTKLKTAIQQLDKELNNTPEECKSWLDIGSGSQTQQLFTEAIDAYSRGLKYSPYCIPLLLQRAEMFTLIDKPEEAAIDCYVILMIEPNSIQALLKYVNALFLMSLYHECIQAAECGLDKCENNCHKQYLINLKLAAEIRIADGKKKLLDEKTKQYQANAAEKKDIPELIEASDSETETLDVPELMEASSNSDDSSSESEATDVTPDITEDQNSSQKEVEDAPPSNENEEEIENKIKCWLKEASQKLLDGEDLLALRKYREVLDEIKAFPTIYKYEESEIVCIKYAFGTSYYKSGGYDDLQRAISVFKGIAEDHCSVTFPAAYFGIALVNRKLNRFKEALHYLQIVEDILEQGTQVEGFFWPESTVIIEETKTENLKALVTDLMNECENPPRPEATCRFHDCPNQPAIYYTDPDFKGFFTIQCSYQCTLQYHPSCWKLFKHEKHLSDKEFLDRNCITPDCDGVIIKIESIDKEGNLGKVFESADSKKSTKKKTKLEKKLEVKEEKRRKRKDSSSKTEVVSETPAEANENQAPSETQPENNKSDVKPEVKEKIEGPSTSNETPIAANAELFTVLKKEKLIDENISKYNSKAKEHKKNRNIISIDEFLERTDAYNSNNEYQQRLHALRQNNQHAGKSHNLKPTAPSFEPQRVSDFTPVETPVPFLEDFPRMPPHTSTSTVTYDTNSMGAVESNGPTFNSSSMLLPPEFSVECAKKNIYSYLKNILCKHGPLKEEDPILVRELQSFPGEANALIADSGGLGKFLQQSIDFAFVGQTYVCTVDQLTKAYDKINKAHIPQSPAELSGNVYSPDPYSSYSSQADLVQYHLNPDAQEYSPSQLVGRNSPELASAITKLRQPLTVDEESNNISSSHLDQGATRDYSIPSVPGGATFSKSGETSSRPTRLQLARKCAEAIKVYASPEANEFRSYIGQFIHPYAIVEVSKKSNAHVQTENTKVENLLKIRESELDRLKELISFLTDENVSLKKQNELLGEQCSSALDNLTKCQKKMSVELPNFKKALEDAHLELEEVKKEFKKKESKLEKDTKVLSESLKKSKEEQSTQKSEMDELQATHKNLQLSLTQAEERINLLRNEKHILKTTLDIQIEKLKDNMKTLEADKINILKRAEAAELKLLHVKKTEYLKRVDSKAAEAVKRMKELQEGMSVANLNPVFVKNFGALLSQIQNYVSKLGTIRIEFSANIDGQINSIKNGTPLEELPSLEMKELPEIPSWTTQMPMQNGTPPNPQAPSWISQVQSAFNPNLSNTYLRPQMTCPPPNLPQMQANQQAFLQRFPHLNTSTILQGAIPKFSSNPTIPTASGSQNPKKLPPGLPNPLSDFKPTPEATQPAKQSVPQASPTRSQQKPSPVVSQAPSTKSQQKPLPVVSQASSTISQQKPLPVVSQASSTKSQQKPLPVVSQPTASVSQPQSVTLPPKAEATLKAKSVSSSSGLDSFGAVSASTSKSSLDSKKACDNYDALELDYTVKVTPKKSKVPESAAASSSKPVSTKNSYEKLIQKLRVVYPEATQAQMAAIIKDYRSQKSNLNGMTVDMIINEIVAMVDEKNRNESKMQKSRMIPSIPLVNRKLASDVPKYAEQNGSSKKSVWAVGEDASRQWHGKDIDEPCTICFEEMTPRTAYKVDCGHTFHLTCIKEWMNKKSDCPICRVHLLLPEDYPAL